MTSLRGCVVGIAACLGVACGEGFTSATGEPDAGRSGTGGTGQGGVASGGAGGGATSSGGTRIGSGGDSADGGVAGGGTSSAGGAGGAGAGGETGGAGGYPSVVCDVPTSQGVRAAPASCGGSTVGCAVDFAGAFGAPGREDGSASDARFVGLYGLTGDGTYLYASVAHGIRRIEIATGQVTTLSGGGEAGYFDGAADEARFSCPRGVSVEGGQLYVADSGNGRIRRVDVATGAVTTVAAGQTFVDPVHVHARTNALFIVERSENRMSVFNLDQQLLSPMAREGTIGNTAGLQGPHGVAFIEEWSLFYIADSGNHVIRKINDLAVDIAQVGEIGQSGFADALGAEARLRSPRGLSARQSPITVYVADHDNHAVRRIRPQEGYAVTTMLGDGSAGHAVGVGRAARATYPTDVHYDPGTNSVFVAEGTVIRRVADTLD